jgi:hypothetical protein
MALPLQMQHQQQQALNRPGNAKAFRCSFKPSSINLRSRGARRIPLCPRAAMPITGEARRIFKEQEANIEGDPSRFLQITEAYWKVTDTPPC